MIARLALAMAAAVAPPSLVSTLSSERNDYNPSTDAAGRTIVFARSDADFANARIMVAHKRGRSWGEPRPIAFTDQRYSDSDPWLTPDGRTLYFVSDRPTASRPDKKDLDIWRSRRTPGGWSAPEHLGDEVNSKGPELGPELHNGMLTFSSVRKGGLGGLDIYQARQVRGAFRTATLLEGPFNSKDSDSDFTLSRDGRLAAFWRGGETAAIFLSRRTASGWTQPVKLGPEVNVGPFNFTPNFTPNGRSLWFASTASRPGQPAGMADIHIASVPPAPK